MLVETFEVTEVDHAGQPECDAEAVALIEQLGLEGQQKFVRRDDDGNAKERTPYRKMTREEMFAYSNLCPKKSKLSEYDDGPIPLRVLQVAAHAKDIFDRIQVWSPESADIKDPVLVGINGAEYSANQSLFILARWGEVLEPFAVCMKRAGQLFRDAYKAKAAKVVGEIQAAATAIDDTPDSQLVTKTLPSGYA